MINKNDILKLDDNIKYLVVSKVTYKNINYFYLVDILNNSNIKFVSIDNGNAIIVKDKILLNKIFNLFIMDLKNSI